MPSGYCSTNARKLYPINTANDNFGFSGYSLANARYAHKASVARCMSDKSKSFNRISLMGNTFIKRPLLHSVPIKACARGRKLFRK